MLDKKTLTHFAIFSALSLGVVLAVMLFFLINNQNPIYISYLICSTLILAGTNWQQLSQNKKTTFYHWLGIAGILLVGISIMWLSTTLVGRVFSDKLIIENHKLYSSFLLFHTVIVLAFLLSFRHLIQSHLSLDENFNRATHQFLFSSLIYSGFLFLSAVILSLGFFLMELLGWHLWEDLGDIGQSVVMGLTLGANFLFLNLIPPFDNRHRPPAFLLIFPSIILGFVGVYLLALPFQAHLTKVIDSGIRLTTAAILWLFLIYLNDPKRWKFNALAAGTGLILTVLSLRGIYIRVDEYGLTPSRIYATLGTIFLLCGHGFVFLKALSSKSFPNFSARCLPSMMGFFAIFFTAATFIPIARWSLESQVERYTVGWKNIKQFRKYDFIRYGEDGEKALQKVRAFHQNNPQFLAKLEDFDKSAQQIREDKLKKIPFFPADLQLTPEVEKAIISELYTSCRPDDSAILAIDAGHDNKQGILVLMAYSTDLPDKAEYHLYFFPDSSSAKHYWSSELEGTFNPQVILEALKKGDFHYQKPHFEGLKINGLPQIDFPHIEKNIKEENYAP